MPEHGERIRGEEFGRKRGWCVYLVCVDCEEGRVSQWKEPPFAERCASCHRARYGHTLGPLSIPVAERKRFRHEG
jgi:flavoprotein